MYSDPCPVRSRMFGYVNVFWCGGFGGYCKKNVVDSPTRSHRDGQTENLCLPPLLLPGAVSLGQSAVNVAMFVWSAVASRLPVSVWYHAWRWPQGCGCANLTPHPSGSNWHCPSILLHGFVNQIISIKKGKLHRAAVYN